MMSKVLEVYRILKDKLGEEEARVVAEAFEEVKGVRENLATRDDVNKLERRIYELEKRIEILRKEVKNDTENLRKETKENIARIENRLWWIVGIILVQWLSLMIAILFR